MTTKLSGDARVGDRVEVRGLHGQPARRGEVIEVLGGAGHERYLVRWDARHESIVYPADGVSVVHRPNGARSTA